MELDNENNNSDTELEISNNEISNKIKENELLKNLKYEYQQFEIRDFYDCYLSNGKEKKINFKPVYQRTFSWNSSKQDLFIDSIINNYIIPPIILIKLENEEYEYECIDGQHRLCVIKHFIETKPIDTQKPYYIRYKKIEEDKIYNVFYDDTFDNRDKDKKMYIRNKTNFNQDEKRKFDTRTITILKISNYNVKNKDGMERLKKSMFLRLQNGERVSSVDKFKNIDKPIINALNSYKLLSYATYENENSNWNKLLDILDIPLRQKNHSHTKVKYIHIFLITSLLIINEKSFDIGSYLELNILKYIEDNHSVFKKNITIETWKKNIDTFEKFIINLHKDFILQTDKYLHKNIIYIILFQFINNKDKYEIYKSNISKLIVLYKTNKIFKNKEEKQEVVDFTDFKNFILEIDKTINVVNKNYKEDTKVNTNTNNSTTNTDNKIQIVKVNKNIDIYNKNIDLLKNYHNTKNNYTLYGDEIKKISKNIKHDRDISINDIKKVIYEYNNKNSITSNKFDIFIEIFESNYDINTELITSDDIDSIVNHINIEKGLIMESFYKRKFIDKFKAYVNMITLGDKYLNILTEYYDNNINNANVKTPKKKDRPELTYNNLKDELWN